jgi:translation initiation factor 6 (eIF-6)
MMKKKKKEVGTSQNFRGVDAMQLTKTFKACGNFILAEDIVNYCYLELLW